MTGTLSTSFIKEFQKRARHIKNKGILPIYNFIKLQFSDTGCAMYKTSGEHWLCLTGADKNIPAPASSFLFDEAKLYSLVNKTSAAYIAFTLKVTKTEAGIVHTMHLVAGNTKWPMKVEPVNIFPAMPIGDGECRELTQEMMDAINMAGNYTTLPLPDANPVFKPVYLTPEHIAACSHEMICTSNIPAFDAAFQPELCEVLRGLNSAIYFTANTYNFIQSDNALYGFLQPEIKVPQYQYGLVPREPGVNFTLPRKEVISFCEMAIDASKTPWCKLSGSNGVITLQVHDTGVDDPITTDIEASFDGVISVFGFNAVFMRKAITGMPYESIIMRRDMNRYFITGDDGTLTGVIIELSLP